MKSILDPSFRYRSSIHTDLKTTFAEIRRREGKKQQADRVHRRRKGDRVAERTIEEQFPV
jgi:hypothetical protein